MTGCLYVVATPIGNLEDITLRALRVLKEVDYILCEDKRVTIRLLNKYAIKTKLISCHKFNEEKITNYVLDLLKSGNNIALVSDSGTPLISDPGSNLIAVLNKNNIRVIPIPGSSALSTALSVFPGGVKEFLFLGFLPGRRSRRIKKISTLKERADIVVLFVAPHDFKKYLSEIYEFYPDVKIFYGRELTKIYEETWAGNIKELIEKLNSKDLRGEIVLFLCFA